MAITVLRSYRNADTEIGSPLVSYRDSETQVGVLESYRNADTEIGGNFESYRDSETQILASSWAQPWINPEVAFAGGVYTMDPTYLSLRCNGLNLELGPFVQSWEINLPFHGISTFTANLIEHSDLTIDADGLPSGAQAGRYHVAFPATTFKIPSPHFHKHNNTTSNALRAILTIGDNVWTGCPTFVQNSPGTWSGIVLPINGEDLQALLNRQLDPETDPVTDIVVGDNSFHTAHSVVRDSVTRGAGTYFAGVDLQFKDFPVGTIRRQSSTPLEWIDLATRQEQIARSMRQDTLVLKAPIPPDQAVPKFHFIDQYHIMEGGWEFTEDVSGLQTKFVVDRIDQTSGIIGSGDCTGYDCIGRTGNVSFAVATNNVIGQFKVTNGVLENYTYFDEQDNPATLFGPGTSAYQGVPVKRVEFTYRGFIGTNNVEATASTASFMPHYEISFFGGPTKPSGFESSFTAVANVNSTLLSIYGQQGDYDTIDDPALVNTGQAQNMANGLVMHAENHIFTGTLITPLVNTEIFPGDTILITDGLTDMDAVPWFVDHIKLNGNENGETLQTFTVSRGWF